MVQVLVVKKDCSNRSSICPNTPCQSIAFFISFFRVGRSMGLGENPSAGFSGPAIQDREHLFLDFHCYHPALWSNHTGQRQGEITHAAACSRTVIPSLTNGPNILSGFSSSFRKGRSSKYPTQKGQTRSAVCIPPF